MSNFIQVGKEREVVNNLNTPTVVTSWWEYVNKNQSKSRTKDANGIEFVKNERYELIKELIKDRRFLLVVGPTGCGKTRPVEMATLDLGYGFYRINMNGHTTDEPLVGQMRIRSSNGDTETYWEDGVLIKAVQHGLDENGNVVGNPAVLLIDEIDAAPPETLFVLQAILEKQPQLELPQDGGRIVPVHPGFVIVATANTKGTGDMVGGYVGTNRINFATRDRFDYLLEVDYDTELEKSILQNILKTSESTLDKSDAIYGLELSSFIKEMMKFTKVIRKSQQEGAISLVISMRRLIQWAQAIVKMKDATKAFRLAVYNFADKDEQDAIAEVYQRHFNYDLIKDVSTNSN